jgi:hypothetical protein
MVSSADELTLDLTDSVTIITPNDLGYIGYLVGK